uniref:Zona pellucida protein AX 4 n=1 Tax=Haplochromis burtoni TaxID=8153 RepID=A0A3Q2VW90_HAPBU
MFSFNFNLIATHKGKKASYALNKTCTLSLQWSHREVTCEMNYMEQTVLRLVHFLQVRSTASSDWQVTFQRPEEQMPSMNVSQARKRGYTFDSRDGRLLFRTPYGQPDSLSTEVEDVPVEAVYATVFSRQNWVVLMVDLLAACGLLIAEKRGYIVEKHKGTVQIGIPYNAEGGHRKSFVIGSLYEFYAFDLSVEQISVDRDYVDTMLQFRRTLVTPLLPCTIFTRNQTVLEEQMFTIYLGDVPEDVMLVSIQLNERDFTLPFTNTSTYKVTEVLHPNGTHGYTLKVLFHDPVVKQKFFIEDAVLQFMLDINYTLAVLPGNDSYYHLASIVALFTDVSPPAFDAVCSESGIRFKLNSQPFDYLWELTIGLDVLTSDLADQRGYIFSNDSQSLQLDVPLATHGYKYQDVTLKGFSGTFEILVRVRETSEVQTSTVKTCLFNPKEFISKLCSTDGMMTVVANLPPVVSGGGRTLRMSLMDNSCGPKDMNGTRALFSFPVNSCGFIFEDYVTYQNEIFYNKNDQNMDLVSSDATERYESQNFPVHFSFPHLHRSMTLKAVLVSQGDPEIHMQSHCVSYVSQQLDATLTSRATQLNHHEQRGACIGECSVTSLFSSLGLRVSGGDFIVRPPSDTQEDGPAPSVQQDPVPPLLPSAVQGRRPPTPQSRKRSNR